MIENIQHSYFYSGCATAKLLVVMIENMQHGYFQLGWATAEFFYAGIVVLLRKFTFFCR